LVDDQFSFARQLIVPPATYAAPSYAVPLIPAIEFVLLGVAVLAIPIPGLDAAPIWMLLVLSKAVEIPTNTVPVTDIPEDTVN
jgi:hypothetical protein